MDNILPCRICGIAPRFISGTQRDGKYIAVVIAQCDCDSTKWCDSDEKAISSWNEQQRGQQAERERVLALVKLFREKHILAHTYDIVQLELSIQRGDQPKEPRRVTPTAGKDSASEE